MNILSKQNKSILREMVATDFKVRYQGSFLGYAWSLFRPLFMFTVLYVVFTYVFKMGKAIPHYPVYLLLGIVLWNFMAETTQQGVSSIVSNGNLLRKINIPKYLPVLASSLSALTNLGLNLIVVLGFIIFNGVTLKMSWILFPFLLLELYVFSLAMAFLLSALYVKYRDVNYIWELLLQAGFYATPIIYAISFAPEKLQKLMMLNPMAQIIQDSRKAIISHEYASPYSVLGSPKFLIPFIIVIVIVFISIKYFKSQAGSFAENV